MAEDFINFSIKKTVDQKRKKIEFRTVELKNFLKK